jgi:hypothetical protein
VAAPFLNEQWWNVIEPSNSDYDSSYGRNPENVKNAKFKRVEELLNSKWFPPVPQLWNLYRLRNDAFHDGQLSNRGAEEAQAARTARRALVRAQILNLLDMTHANHSQEFMNLYAT